MIDHVVLVYTWWYRYMYMCVWIKDHYQRSCCFGVNLVIQVYVQVYLNKGTLSEIMLCRCIPDDTGTCTGVFEFRYTIRDYHRLFQCRCFNLLRLFDSDSLFYFKPNLSLTRSDCHLESECSFSLHVDSDFYT